jgi:hypothetical protein
VKMIAKQACHVCVGLHMLQVSCYIHAVHSTDQHRRNEVEIYQNCGLMPKPVHVI